MGAYTRDELPVVFEREGVGKACQLVEGRMSLQWESYEPGFDPGPLYHGLPEDMCQCHHYGYVLRGSARFRTKDGELVLRAGRVYHLPPGHVPLELEEHVELIEFTDSDQLAETMRAIEDNIQLAHDQPVGDLA